MTNMKLILLEGIPGSGKSTSAQLISGALTRAGLKHKWWYEEEVGHPVYVFEDSASLHQVVHDLENGSYQKVIDDALAKWHQFSTAVQSSDEIIIIDSCLFGYLSWSLFPQLVPPHEIMDYVAEVERIIATCNPQVIYYHQQDVGDALARIFARRLGDTERQFVEAATQSKYGQAHQLSGFKGTVAYWKAYRAITDELFERLSLRKLSIDNTDGAWPEYERQLMAFLGLAAGTNNESVTVNLQRFAGVYDANSKSKSEDDEHTCEVRFDRDSCSLIVDRLPQVWTQTPLIQRGDHVFDVQSLPLQVHFEEDDNDQSIRLHVTGPTLLGGKVDVVWMKRFPQHSS